MPKSNPRGLWRTWLKFSWRVFIKLLSETEASTEADDSWLFTWKLPQYSRISSKHQCSALQKSSYIFLGRISLSFLQTWAFIGIMYMGCWEMQNICIALWMIYKKGERNSEWTTERLAPYTLCIRHLSLLPILHFQIKTLKYHISVWHNAT